MTTVGPLEYKIMCVCVCEDTPPYHHLITQNQNKAPEESGKAVTNDAVMHDGMCRTLIKASLGSWLVC